MEITAYKLAERYAQEGLIQEISGKEDNPFILAMLKLDSSWPDHDEVPWCSAYVNFIAWNLKLPRSKSLAARSWLLVGTPIQLAMATQGFDVVILKRGGPNQPGPSVIDAQGHVGFFSAYDGYSVYVLGGNQSNKVNIQPFPTDRILGIRRLYNES